MTTTATSARERILDSAEELVHERGFTAATLDSILDRADASKGAFFHHFENKDALGRALLRRYADRDAEMLEEFMSVAEAESDDPGEQVIIFIREFERAALDIAQAMPGCLFVSFIYERVPGIPTEDDVIVESIELWRERVLEKLELAAKTRSSLAGVDLPSLADHGFTVFEGGFILARATNESERLSQQIGHFRHYLELLIES